VTEDELYLMSPMEIVFGYLLGHTGSLPRPADRSATPRQALERVVRTALERPPCGVAFSGGRDSSAVLAIATHVARRDGLPEPVPITRVFPAVEEAAEREWQETVVRHLGLRDWHRAVIHDELDVVGPLAAEHLAAHGVVWPPTIAGDRPLVDAVPGGSVIDGEGGDEVLGFAAHRMARLTPLLRHPRPMRWRRVRSALGALAPAGVRARHERRGWGEEPFPWLRPAGRDALFVGLDQAERELPLSFAASVRMVPLRRSQVLSRHNRRLLARGYDVDLSSPLLHPDFVQSVARDGGLFGKGDRTTALRALVPDLLPDAVLARTSKAVFTRCYMGFHTRAFAERWTGDGVDPALVDPQELKRSWMSEDPVAPSAALLQQAWIAAEQLVAERNQG
jgi:asparagine synthase (glutamine-hydrolysing)